MQIHRVHNPVATALIDPGGQRRSGAAGGGASGDQVSISLAGRHAALVGDLTRQVLALPESRPAVVDAARQALVSGELDTPAAVAATARAIALGP